MGLLKLQIETNQDLSIFEVVRKLREQRWGMVKNLMQYEYLYEFAEERIMNLQTGMTSLSDDSD
jgi:protein tyrosine phosphatase